MSGSDPAGNLAPERKITDGLNLVYHEIAVLREEVRESRREAREARKADRREAREAREADRKEALAAREADRREVLAAREADRRETNAARQADRRETNAGFAKLEARIEERTEALRREMAARFGGVENSIQRLAEMTGRSLERGSWIRRLAWGLGGLGLLVLGALARPLAGRAVAALFGGG